MTASILLDRDQLRAEIHQALKAWDSPDGEDASTLSHLLLWRRLRDESDGGSSFVGIRLLTNRLLDRALADLERRHEDSAELLRRRFLEKMTQQEVANLKHISPDTLSRRQRAAINGLTDIVYQQEKDLREAEVARLESALPIASYSRLIGLDAARESLVEQLREDGRPAITAIAGLGGIGKTALADAVVRMLIRHFHYQEVIWLDFEPETMSGHFVTIDQAENWVLSALSETISPDDIPFEVEARRRQVHNALRARRHLIILDNLENDNDTALLIAAIQPLAGTSRFLVTTRVRPATAQPVFTHHIDELSSADTRELLLEYGRELGLADIELLRDEDFDAIYRTVGGHPLALKLVISSLDPQPLPHILAGLSGGRRGTISEMYRDIYEQTWRTLSPAARELLETMTMVGSQGADPDQLLSVSGLEDGVFWHALTELRNRSLLELRGTPQSRRYGVHRLTERFLEAKVSGYTEEG